MQKTSAWTCFGVSFTSPWVFLSNIRLDPKFWLLPQRSFDEKQVPWAVSHPTPFLLARRPLQYPGVASQGLSWDPGSPALDKRVPLGRPDAIKCPDCGASRFRNAEVGDASAQHQRHRPHSPSSTVPGYFLQDGQRLGVTAPNCT